MERDSSRALGASILLVLGVLAGCSSAPEPQRPGLAQTAAAEPGDAPGSAPPRGQLIALPDGAPEGAVLDSSTGILAVALRRPGRLALVNTATSAVRVLPAPGSARHLSLAGPGELLVSGEDTDTLSTVRLPAGRVEQEVRVGKTPHDAARVGKRLFVSNEFSGSVGVIQNGRMARQIRGFAQPGGLTATNGRVAAVDVRTNTLHVIDAASGRRIAVLPAGKGPSHVRPIGDGRVAVADTRGNAVLSYRITGTPRQLSRVQLPGRAYGLDADTERGFVYATAGNTNTVFRLRLGADGTLGSMRAVRTVRQPNDVAVDPRSGTVYVIGKAAANVQRLTPAAFSR